MKKALAWVAALCIPISGFVFILVLSIAQNKLGELLLVLGFAIIVAVFVAITLIGLKMI